MKVGELQKGMLLRLNTIDFRPRPLDALNALSSGEDWITFDKKNIARKRDPGMFVYLGERKRENELIREVLYNDRVYRVWGSDVRLLEQCE